MLERRPIDSPLVNILRSHGTMWSLEPYGGVELVGWGIVSRIHIEVPRNLDETRLCFVLGEEDGVECVSGCLDFEAVLLVSFPVLRSKQ
jgi:hypothetical protein